VFPVGCINAVKGSNQLVLRAVWNITYKNNVWKKYRDFNAVKHGGVYLAWSLYPLKFKGLIGSFDRTFVYRYQLFFALFIE